MLKIFRTLRQRLLTENKFSKYLIYAAGEIVLVVIGILIAIQINNLNQNRIEKKALSGYLNSISNNIKEDLNKIAYLIDIRSAEIGRMPHMDWALFSDVKLEITDIVFAAETLSAISDLDYFTADISGFESIKSSGYLSKLQGQDLEVIIYKYYNLIQEITKKEDSYNEILTTTFRDFSYQGFENLIYLNYPDYIADEAELRRLQPSIREIIFHPTALTLYNHTFYKSPALIVQLENLSVIGNEVVRMIANNKYDSDEVSIKNLEKLYDVSGRRGYPKVFQRGATNVKFYGFGHAAANNKELEISHGINEVSISATKNDWSVFYFRIPPDALIQKPTKDYSHYDSIQLRLKGHKSGETVLIALKDSEDPDDGTETKIPLTLTPDWETYEIPLSAFTTANLKELFVVASFILESEAQEIHIRDVAFI